jgi:ACS family allantoate permease-like MFS transporter
VLITSRSLVVLSLRHRWKKEQFIEALVDPKTWLFALFSALDNVPNSLTNQNAIIIKSWGFSTLNTTLLGCVTGVVEIITIASGAVCPVPSLIPLPSSLTMQMLIFFTDILAYSFA